MALEKSAAAIKIAREDFIKKLINDNADMVALFSIYATWKSFTYENYLLQFKVELKSLGYHGHANLLSYIFNFLFFMNTLQKTGIALIGL